MDIQGIDPVAIYAALMSTIALGWQLRNQERARRPQVKVEMRWATITLPVGEAVGAAQVEARTRRQRRAGSRTPT